MNGAELDRGGVNVLVRGDGGPELFIAKRICSAVQPDDSVARVLLVDFGDRFHPILRRWSRQRSRVELFPARADALAGYPPG